MNYEYISFSCFEDVYLLEFGRNMIQFIHFLREIISSINLLTI